MGGITAFFVFVVSLNRQAFGGFTVVQTQTEMLFGISLAATFSGKALASSKTVEFWVSAARTAVGYFGICAHILIVVAANFIFTEALIIAGIIRSTSVTDVFTVDDTAFILGGTTL